MQFVRIRCLGPCFVLHFLDRGRVENPQFMPSITFITFRPDACKPPGYGVPPKAHYPERHRDARSKSRQRAVKVPANRARYSEPHPVRSSVAPLPTHRCPWLQSNNPRSSASPMDGPEFLGRPRCVPDKRADPGKLLPKDFPTPCAAVARQFLRRHETEAPLGSASHSSASES